MRTRGGSLGRSIADAGALLERATRLTHPSISSLGRLGAAVSAVRLSARLLPVGRRLLARNPLLGSLLIAGLVTAFFATRSMRARPRPGTRGYRFQG
jgi:hypothetical protein